MMYFASNVLLMLSPCCNFYPFKVISRCVF